MDRPSTPYRGPRGSYYKPPRPTRSGEGVRCYAAYLRCSNDDQARDGYTTIDTQRELTAAYVQERGGSLVETYVDDGWSGTKTSRPALNRLFKDAADKKFDTVVVTYMSRLGRGDAYTIAQWELSKHNVRVELVKENFDEGLAGYTTEKFTQLMDGMYPVQVKEWTITKMERMHASGYFIGGQIPFGCLSIPAPGGTPKGKDGKCPRVLVTDEPNAPIVRNAFEVLLTTRCVMDVVDYLVKATGKVWGYRKTAYLLAHRIYLGESTWRGVTRPNPATQIVDPVVFDLAQEILQETADRTRRRARRPDLKASEPHAYYLRGLVFCGCCTIEETGEPYRMSSKDAIGRTCPVRYYECLRHVKYREGTCAVKRVNASDLHAAIVQEFGLMAAHPWRIRKHIEAAAKNIAQASTIRPHLESAQRRLKAVNKRLENMTNAVATGGKRFIAAMERAISDAEEEREILIAEVRRLKEEHTRAASWRPNIDQIQETLSLFLQIWERRTDEERSLLLPLIVDRVDMQSRQIACVTILPSFATGYGLQEVLSGPSMGEISLPIRSQTPVPVDYLPNSLRRSSPLPIQVCIPSKRIKDKANGEGVTAHVG